MHEISHAGKVDLQFYYHQSFFKKCMHAGGMSFLNKINQKFAR